MHAWLSSQHAWESMVPPERGISDPPSIPQPPSPALEEEEEDTLRWSLGQFALTPGYGFNNNNNRRLVTLAEHTSDHGRQTNSSTEEKGEQV